MKNNTFPIAPGSKIGLFGGSFNPAHEWHFEVSNNALKELNLDKVIWLVSPENPLKDSKELMQFDERFASAQKEAKSEYFFVSDFEKKNNIKYSVETVSKIKNIYPETKFIWIMGSDCAAEISQWKEWKKFLNLIPIAIYPRPSFKINSEKLDIIKEKAKQIEEGDQLTFVNAIPPAITFIPGPMSDISSTKIREFKDG